MARGRMTNKTIASDKRMHRLSSDTSRMAFLYAKLFADREGRVEGDPALLRSLVFPRRMDVTDEIMESFIQEWHDQGLVVWYEANGLQVIYLPDFEDEQVGLRKEREAASSYPAMPEPTPEPEPDEVRSDSGVLPEEVQSNSPIKYKLNINVNKNVVVGGGEPEVGGDEFPAEDKDKPGAQYVPYLKIFEELTGISELAIRSPGRIFDEFPEMLAAGVTPEDYRAGVVAQMQSPNKKLSLIHPCSFIKAAINEAVRRRGESIPDPPAKKNGKGGGKGGSMAKFLEGEKP